MMYLPQMPRWLVGYVVFISLGLLLTKLFEWQSTADLLHEILKSQIQHGILIDTTALSVPLIDPLNPSTYLASPLAAQPNHFTYLLTQCHPSEHNPNPQTSHITLPYNHLNISLTPPSSTPPHPLPQYFNPTLLRLPSYAIKSPTANGAKYLLVTRLVTDGQHQESHICLADLCSPHNSSDPHSDSKSLPPDVRPCDEEDISVLGPQSGLRCTTEPVKMSVPPTASRKCTGSWKGFTMIPGFHDPRVFWSNRGEPLIILNSASAYGCVGLWLQDLRAMYAPLAKILRREDKRKEWETPPIQYRRLTELTRWDRSQVEKNWMLFFPGDDGEMVVQYDLLPRYEFVNVHSTENETAEAERGEDGSEYQHQDQGHEHDNDTDQDTIPTTGYTNHTLLNVTKRAKTALPEPPSSQYGRLLSSTGGRTMSHLLAVGLTTPNITSISEATCFPPSSLFDSRSHLGHWHQSTNALKLILCTRSQLISGSCCSSSSGGDPKSCGPREWVEEGREVHLAIGHRKFSNAWGLPLRYERWSVVWEGRKSYRMLGVSKAPILFEGEIARGLEEEGGDVEGDEHGRDGNNTTYGPPELVRKGLAFDDLSGMVGGGNSANGSAGNDEAGPAGKDRRGGVDAYFTYTPSLSWVWQPTPHHFLSSSLSTSGFQRDEGVEADIDELEHLGMGFLDDEVLVGVGWDDTEQSLVRVPVGELVRCFRLCGGEGLEGSDV